MKIKSAFLVILNAMMLSLISYAASYVPVNEIGKKLPDKLTVLPKGLLREYDPVTIFFPEKIGPAQRGPEDRPEQYVRRDFQQPGEFRWLNSRILQFRPSSPWPVLKSFQWTIQNKHFRFFTVISPPMQITPLPGSRDLDSIDWIRFSFKVPLSEAELRSILSFDIRPLPGMDKSRERILNDSDYEIKMPERKSAADKYTYIVIFKKPVTEGKKLTMRFKLSLNPSFQGARVEYSFFTKRAFRLIQFGAGSDTLPVAANGSLYEKEQVINGGNYGDEIFLTFSHYLSDPGFAKISKLVRITPVPENFRYFISGNRLYINAGFKRETIYKVDVRKAMVYDNKGRLLDTRGPSRFYFYFPKKSSFIEWNRGQGVMERYGPQNFPMQGRAVAKVDLKVYKINPLDRRVWPFPESPVSIYEAAMPPGPGEEPRAAVKTWRYISTSRLKRHLKMLGSPEYSGVVDLPIDENSGRAKFGLNLYPILVKIAGKGKPGTYLVGYRKLNGSGQRSFVRIQVSDLSLSVLQDIGGVRLFVTSFKTALPLSGVTVKIQGFSRWKNNKNYKWSDLVKGKTDANGSFLVRELSSDDTVTRVILQKGDDILVLKPDTSLSVYQNNYWKKRRVSWLNRLYHPVEKSDESVRAMLFTERPVYKPEDPVHIKAIVRARHDGRLYIPKRYGSYLIRVTDPSGKKWDYKKKLSKKGGLYLLFDEKKLPTGYFDAALYGRDWKGLHYITATHFNKEAYKIPRFEVLMNGPKRVPMDKSFKVGLVARYYAGGVATKQKVDWKVTQFPYVFIPRGFKDFLFSTDARYSRQSMRFQGRGTIWKNGVTDDNGAGSITLDPTLEPNAMPRRYVVEATVTGDDAQTVSSSYDVVALPSFVLGLKVKRFIKDSKVIEPEILALDENEKIKPNLPITVRLIKREWHAQIRESSLSKGKPDYVTEKVDIPVEERKILTQKEAMKLKFEVSAPGIYIVEIEARDKLGRSQSVAADVYVGGEKDISWEESKKQLSFKAVADKKSYRDGEKARILLQSPVPEAQVLAVVEKPGHTETHWIDIMDGQGEFDVPVKNIFAPALSITFVMVTPRLYDAQGNSLTGELEDQGKPRTLITTLSLPVKAVKNILKVEIEHPEEIMPGKEMNMRIALKDDMGRNVSGEVTLWLVDKAVLALGKEQKLSPLKTFLSKHPSKLTVYDFRNNVLGEIKLKENPGGGEYPSPKAMRSKKMMESSAEMDELLNDVTVRKNFKTVAYYSPAIKVSKDGKTRIKIKMPDNLTVFEIRAVAVSGENRFGTARSKVETRLPLIIQPALPRFVRFGDEIYAGGIGRVVSGPGGAGIAKIEIKGGVLKGKNIKSLSWVKNRAERLFFPFKVDSAVYNKNGKLENKNLEVLLSIARQSDKVSDAFKVKIPIKSDRDPVKLVLLTNIAAHSVFKLPVPLKAVRTGSVGVKILLSRDSAIPAAVNGLEYLLNYPYGCLEQRLSKAYSLIAMKDILSRFGMQDKLARLDEIYSEAMKGIQSCQLADGRFGYWPGSSTGYIYLTAYVLEFLTAAKKAGFEVDNKLFQKTLRVLKRSLRSDYSHFVDGYHYQERVEAFYALSLAGYFNSSYVESLARESSRQNIESRSRFLLLLLQQNYYDKKLLESLKNSLWNQTTFLLQGGKETFAGMQFGNTTWGGPLNNAEMKSLASVFLAVSFKKRTVGRLKLMLDYLVGAAGPYGWGNTSVNASVLLALKNYFENRKPVNNAITVSLQTESEKKTAVLDSENPACYWNLNETGKGVLKNTGNRTVSLMYRLTYLPVKPTQQAEQKGFVLEKDISIYDRKNKRQKILEIQKSGLTLKVAKGAILEEHVKLINPENRYFVAVTVPIAAGTEPMNPALRTSGPEAQPSRSLTLKPSYVEYLDDRVSFFYDYLPRGQYDFVFRTRAMTEGSFIEPAAHSEMMYREWVRGNSPELRIKIGEK